VNLTGYEPTSLIILPHHNSQYKYNQYTAIRRPAHSPGPDHRLYTCQLSITLLQHSTTLLHHTVSPLTKFIPPALSPTQEESVVKESGIPSATLYNLDASYTVVQAQPL
jgi:hypothetical protein